MRAKLCIVSFVFGLIFFLNGCSTYSPMAQLEEFTYELKYNSSSYGIDEWKDALQTYVGILESFEGLELTEEELREFGRLNGTCTGYLLKGALMVAIDTSSSGISFLEGLADGLQSSINEEDISNTAISAISSFIKRLEAIIDKFN